VLNEESVPEVAIHNIIEAARKVKATQRFADPTADLRHKSDGETLEFRYWSGTQWKAA
jgi:hypothetical protein